AARVSQQPQVYSGQPEQVAFHERPADPVLRFQLDRAGSDHDQGTAPAPVATGPLAPRRNDDLADGDRACGSLQQGISGRLVHQSRTGRLKAAQRSGRKLVTSTILPPVIRRTLSPVSRYSRLPRALR